MPWLHLVNGSISLTEQEKLKEEYQKRQIKSHSISDECEYFEMFYIKYSDKTD